MTSTDAAYNPMEYWNRRKDPNNPAGRETERVSFDTAYIRMACTGSNSILELGPGVGRTLPAYRPDQQITTLDISRIYQTELTEAAAACGGLQLDQHFIDDLDAPYPFPDNSFDCAVCFQVFIHQPPDLFAHSLSELCRVARKVVVGAGLHANLPGFEPPAGIHAFAHDYLSAATANQMAVTDLLMRDRALYFSLVPAAGLFP